MGVDYTSNNVGKLYQGGEEGPSEPVEKSGLLTKIALLALPFVLASPLLVARGGCAGPPYRGPGFHPRPPIHRGPYIHPRRHR